MKKWIVISLLFIGHLASAQNPPPDEPQTILDIDAVNTIKAVMAVPQAATAFNDRTELKSVTVIHQTGDETVYLLDGKRRGNNGGFRRLQIMEKRTLRPATTVTYTPHLIP
jgi:hypothetical protein